MGFLGGLLQAGGTLALDVLASLASGSTQKARDLLNKSYRSDAYGTPISRFRGTARAQGKVWWMTKIHTTVRKTSSGGLFGIGQKTVYYNLYSASIFNGFGEKLGGGAAAACLRLWADGKLLFNAVASNASITGSVTVTTVPVTGQSAGNLNILVDVASGAHLVLNPTDLITVPGDPQPYEVESPVDVTGPKTGVAIQIWPPLRVTLAGGGALTIPGTNSPVWDLSSFDPDPHDGSHDAGGYNCPPGGAAFYLGSDTQQPDPTIIKNLGVGNVPGYRGRQAVMLRDLQLRNYGDRPPQITGLWAFDTINGSYPLTGPIANASGTVLVTGGGGVSLALPSSGPSSFSFANPLLNQLPYVWAQYFDGTHEIIVRINTTTNQIEASLTELNAWSGIVVDAEGFVYQVGPSSLNHWDLYKWDGFAMSLSAEYGPGNAGAHQPSIGQPDALTVWESQQSLFGNPVKVKLVAMLNALGGINFFDANSMVAFGSPSAGPSNPLVEYQIGKTGNPSLIAGNPTSVGIATPYSGSGLHQTGNPMCVDGDGNVWICQNDTLSKYDCQFQSSVALDSNNLPVPVLLPPTFARTDYNIGAVTGSGASIVFNAAENTIVVLSGGAAAKFDIQTGAIIASGATFASSSYSGVDVMGSLLGSGSPTFSRLDASGLQVTASYNLTNFIGGAGVAGATYDQLTDSLWFANSNDNKIYRAFLDRGNGLGIGLDSLVSSLMTEVYDSSQYDVSQLTAAGQTVYGWELTREERRKSLDAMEQYYQFDDTEIDGKIVFVPRGQAPVLIIPESDLGCLSDPFKYEPRLLETVEDEYDVPESVHIRYYDPLKDWQQAVQEAKRVSQPYPSSLASAKPLISTQQRLDITVPLTENATPVKQQAIKILWEAWASRTQRKAKLPYGGAGIIPGSSPVAIGPAYWRLDKTDVVLYAYKGALLETRIEEVDLGSSLAIEITGRNQDRSVYDSTFLPASSAGLGSGTPATQPPLTNDNYTLSPVNPLSSPNSTTIEIAACIATFTSGLRTSYAARTIANGHQITVPNPGSGNSAIYYVTYPDPTFTGDQPPGTPSISPLFDTNPANVHLGETGFINLGAVTVLGSGATTNNPNPLPGGQPGPTAGALVAEIAFGPTQQADVDGFKVAHNIGSVPSNVQIQIVQGSPPIVGDVWFQAFRYDAQYVYLVASAAGITGYLEIWD